MPHGNSGELFDDMKRCALDRPRTARRKVELGRGYPLQPNKGAPA